MPKTQTPNESAAESITYDSPWIDKELGTPQDLNELAVTTQLEASFAPSVSFEEETLTSMSLIDDSAMQMHGLMRSLAERAKSKIRTAEYIQPQEIAPITRCASEIRSLLRLKLDIWKERKNLGGK